MLQMALTSTVPAKKLLPAPAHGLPPLLKFPGDSRLPMKPIRSAPDPQRAGARPRPCCMGLSQGTCLGIPLWGPGGTGQEP